MSAARQKATVDMDCVEIYMPKRLRYLPKLYAFLANRISMKRSDFTLEGFSIYEVDGAFRGQALYEERTLVIRLFFPPPFGPNRISLLAKINDLGRSLATTVAVNEEQIWIAHFRQAVSIFRGKSAPQKKG